MYVYGAVGKSNLTFPSLIQSNEIELNPQDSRGSSTPTTLDTIFRVRTDRSLTGKSLSGASREFDRQQDRLAGIEYLNVEYNGFIKVSIVEDYAPFFGGN